MRTPERLSRLLFSWGQRRDVAALALAVLAAGLAGCGAGSDEAASGASALEESAGSFEAQVRGALRDTLGGVATARRDSAGRLAGIELGGRGGADTSRAGFSFELATRPATPARTFTVSQQEGGREDTSFALMNAYLRLRGHTFAARAGSLHVERDSSGLRGTFELRLRGSIEAASDAAAIVTGHGRFEQVRVP
jgi:hypothetical protein